MKKTYFAILGAAAILSLATACSSKNVNEPTANESSQSASSESSSNGMDESSPMDDLKEDAKDAVLPSEGTADAKQSTMTGTISDIKDLCLRSPPTEPIMNSASSRIRNRTGFLM